MNTTAIIRSDCNVTVKKSQKNTRKSIEKSLIYLYAYTFGGKTQKVIVENGNKKKKNREIKKRVKQINNKYNCCKKIFP